MKYSEAGKNVKFPRKVLSWRGAGFDIDISARVGSRVTYIK